ncbi:hypothetical protein BDW74DRAFT_147166 [Aspergillus multicolor]|uniref:protein dscB n=1 Tax=Aspergillus multicolor TaxID=41759 RepID=UPI003CCD8997
MQTSGLTNTPLTKALLIYTIAASIALSIFDIKYLASIYVSPHLFPYGQFWRALVWQVAGFANSTEALFAALLVYHVRVVERGWGARKVATFILSTLPYTTLLPPLLLATVIKPLSLGKINYLPSGPTATIFALLAQYHASIPSTFRYTISTSTSTPKPTPNAQDFQNATPKSSPLTLSLTDKSTTYLIAAQLALSQFPYMLLPSAIGWIVGVAWRAEVLPFVAGTGSSGWRVPAWVVGEESVAVSNRSGGAGDAGFEGLRRRLESEAAAASAAASGSAGPSGSGSSRQRAARG